MGRRLTFRQLQAEKGWPHSRQWTSKLAKKGKIPPPEKRPGAGPQATNTWDEDVWDAFTGTFVSAHPQPVGPELTQVLAQALASTSIDAIVTAMTTMRAVIEREGANPSDLIVTLKEHPTVAARATANTTVT